MTAVSDTTAERVERGTPERAAVDKLAEAGTDEARKEIADDSPVDLADATKWFLEGTPDEKSQIHFQINVSADNRTAQWVTWVVQALDRDRIPDIRESAAKQIGDEDSPKVGSLANLRIATEGTVSPDLREVRGAFADPADALEARFAFKPGLIDQIAQKVIKATGYDDEDVKEVDAVKT